MSLLNRKFTLLVLILLVLSIIDTMIMAVTGSKYTFKAVAGKTAYISGKLAEPVDENLVKRYAHLSGKENNRTPYDQIITYTPQYDFLRLRFLEAKGRLWRGILESTETAPQGDYVVAIFQKALGPEEKAPKFTIRLFQNEQAYRKSFFSFAERYLGLAPFWVTLVLLPLVLYCIFITMRDAGKELSDLQAKGIGPIYKLVKGKTDWEVIFGLGSRHGVHRGDHLVVLNKHREPVGKIIATEVGPESTNATYPLGNPIAPDYFIAIPAD
ncbi:MAG: hypothetical protein ISS65_08895 [Desulfobacterales bacterium]|uniref:Uncharacterized protein n=1 Tax=Candidatus Desulfatibia profunda TaxID=2841695 RepID=A0A8J6TI34_9BACT|nr:hypothetical protein [Candidatus Desulfatibia profunda]MBL7180308.1 hypothetical protein [Desulfobacterales bacterium]